MRKYSTDRARAKEFGGTMHTSPVNSTNDFGSKRLGSTTAESTLVKILNSGATRMSYPYDETPYEMTPARAWFSANGSIMRRSVAIRRIQRSDLMDMGRQYISAASTLTPLDSVDKPAVAGYVSAGQVNFFTNSHEPALSRFPPPAWLRGVQRGTVDRAFASPRPPQAHRPQGQPVRERHAAARQCARAFFGEVLPRRHAVHHFRHRDGVPDSLGHDLFRRRGRGGRGGGVTGHGGPPC